MRISHGTRIASIDTACGYGYATDRMLDSLTKLGHVVNQNDPTAPVEIWFDQPNFWKWTSPNQYHIGYLPWESSELWPEWLPKMNDCDEVWTPSPLIANWFTAAGVTAPVHVYPHGVDEIWTQCKRVVEDRFMFLHVGAEALRKGSAETLNAFRAAFPNRNDVGLTFKMNDPSWGINLPGRIKNLNGPIPIDELVGIYHRHHAFVYPSWGEGFGLTPLQAMATGMPTITVPAWAPYAHHLDPRLTVSAQLHDAPWPKVHPGQMFMPDTDDLVDRMRWVVENYDDAQDFAQAEVPAIREQFDWLRFTQEAFTSLEERLKNR